MCRTGRAKLSGKGLVPGLVGEIRGSASRLREIQRLKGCGAQGAEAAANAAREVVFQREARRKRATHARFSRRHTLAKTGNCWFCWTCGFYTAQRVKGLAGRCRGIVQSRGGVLRKLKDGRKAKDCGWLAEPIWHALRRNAADAVQAAVTQAGWDWCEVVHELERDGRGADQPPAGHDSHESQ